ncbi:sodium/potassium/calcium exchanger 3-like isoform X1 [Cydia pomonella]|uniref:sodium/potassium/calcium exchanger 3-like isoform X1 n=2 Tax=Cydia pomonella TaxID=82600 RepID=UPI002ADDD618|nr:sodium/potassium/calcium exchanger 3-like isoform X1 [Cydia pomonella]
MANMLIRTRQVRKFRVAIIIRVVLFFGLPSCYFLARNVTSTSPELSIKQFRVTSGSISSYSSRHLLAVAEPQKNCTPAAILEFPPDGFTRPQRQHGFIVIHCVLAIYCFLLLGAVCEQYFVPAIEIICERLEMEEDVAGATFMAAASSSPELFINCVGTFVTEGDLGVGAVVGSAVFNVLAVPACCGFIAGKAIELDWWSVSRDCLMYAVAVVALILTLLDDKVLWYEALMLVLMYTFYILAMAFNERLGSFVRSGCFYLNKPKMYSEITPLLAKGTEKSYSVVTDNNNNHNSFNKINHRLDLENSIEMARRHNSSDSESNSSAIWPWPGEKSSRWRKALWVLTWPISLLLWLSVPDCRHRRSLYPLTFLMCIVWIGGVSYLVAWIITIIGDTLDVPDSITGLTILAAGTSLPEAVSSVLVTNQGHGTMGISNTIGSNTFDILLCLGLPWLVKSLFYPASPKNHWVAINSSGLSYSAISLLSTLFALYGSLALNKFRLDCRVGVACAALYLGYLALAALIELNVFFPVNLPVCPH